MAVVLITGTSSGIGLATALTLGRAGHKVYATMRNPTKAPELGQTAAAEKLPIKISVMDVDSDSSVKEGIESIRKDAGQIDVLVNNAGVERSGSIEETPLAEFRAVMETNYFGVIRCVQAVAPADEETQEWVHHQREFGGGTNFLPTPMAPYTASKFALEALSECLAQEMKTFNVRVALVEPGIIDTPMARRIGEHGKPSAYAQQKRFANLFIAALKNPASPAFVAETIKGIIESGTAQLRLSDWARMRCRSWDGAVR